MEKNCSRCGAVFGCKNEAPGCWCETVSLTDETRVQLQKSFENCLCPECLALFEKQEEVKSQK